MFCHWQFREELDCEILYNYKSKIRSLVEVQLLYMFYVHCAKAMRKIPLLFKYFADFCPLFLVCWKLKKNHIIFYFRMKTKEISKN